MKVKSSEQKERRNGKNRTALRSDAAVDHILSEEEDEEQDG